MSGLTVDTLARVFPYAPRSRIERFADALNAAMDAYQINTPSRQAAFLAQVAHESGSLRYTREIATGDNYEGRKDLGNTRPGDGRRYAGRGLLQITGRTNYYLCSSALFGDPGILLEDPEQLELPSHAAMSAAWYWGTRGLNALADAGDFDGITRRINGGMNGATERRGHYVQAIRALAQQS